MPEGKATTEGGLSRGVKEALRAWIETNVRHCPAANHLPNRLLNQLPPAWRLAPTEYLFTSLRLPTVYGHDPRQLNPPARHIFYGSFKNRHHCSMKVCLCPIALLLVRAFQKSGLGHNESQSLSRFGGE